MSGQKVKIAARLRPRLAHEIDDGAVEVFHTSDDSEVSLNGGNAGRHRTGSFITVSNPRDPTQIFKFPFTSCYDQDSTQEEIFRRDVEPMIDVVYSGVTVTIFAYGVTSSGKTHTMQGTPSDPGVIPRVVRAMFQKQPQLQCDQIDLSISYMEIYKDEVYDLLVTKDTARKLPVRENDAGQVFVANLSSETISSVEEFDAIYSQATKNRSTGATNLNRESSRSHAVLTIEVKMINFVENKILSGKINLVDLAGSENNKLTGNDPSRMAESSAINKSLSVLGQVVHALNQGASRIPYRNSKLTRILQDALGGSSVGLLICNIAPGKRFRQDTLNTLNFAVRTKNIENKPVINERDSRPQPKPHFAAVQPPPPRLTLAVLQPTSTTNMPSPRRRSLLHKPRSSIPSNPRASLVPSAARGRVQPRAPRVSAFSGAATRFQSFATAGTTVRKMSGGGMGARASFGAGTAGLTEQDIDERISRAVEMEVARRLEQRERERAEEEERREKEERADNAEAKAKTPKKQARETLPSGVLTPLLQRHRDLDDELKNRLRELEMKFERGSKEAQLADVLSPISKKKTGRAYVALARAHSEKGNLQVALDLYRKAESYVPDNGKLKERIIEIEWAVKNDTPFVSSSRKEKDRTKKSRGKKRAAKGERARASVENSGRMLEVRSDVDEWQDEEEVTKREVMDKRGKHHRKGGASGFGAELTNSPTKRSFMDQERADEDVEELGTPPKKQRRFERRSGNWGDRGTEEGVCVAPMGR